MRSTIKRAGVLLATLMMITSCGGNDQPAQPSKTTGVPGLSQSEATDVATEEKKPSILDGTWHIPPVKPAL